MREFLESRPRTFSPSCIRSPPAESSNKRLGVPGRAHNSYPEFHDALDNFQYINYNKTKRVVVSIARPTFRFQRRCVRRGMTLGFTSHRNDFSSPAT
jgi:hypothetical protein